MRVAVRGPGRLSSHADQSAPDTLAGPGADPAALLAAIVASSQDAIVGKTLDGVVLSWNQAAERIFGFAADEIIGRSIRLLIPDDRQAEEDRILAAIRAGERVESFETVRRRKDGAEVRVAVTVSPVHDGTGRVVAASKIARDVTREHGIREALSRSETRFRLMADTISQLAWIADPDGALTWYNQRWYDYTGTTFAEMAGWGWRAVHHPDHLAAVEARYLAHVAAGQPWEDTFPLRGADGEYRWFLSRAAPLRGPGGAILCWFGTNTDITAQREAERRIELLMLEVNHRAKNMLAMIQSLARRSIDRSLPAGADFVARLEQRIACLAANQDLLVRGNWTSVPLDRLVAAQLAFLGEARAQVTSGGPALLLAPPAAETIGMALHELATNALKYGALSVSGGKVRLAWSVAAGLLELRWSEREGPPLVGPPPACGFGSRLIADVPRGRLGAEVELDYAPGGLRWLLRCPAAAALA